MVDDLYWKTIPKWDTYNGNDGHKDNFFEQTRVKTHIGVVVMLLNGSWGHRV